MKMIQQVGLFCLFAFAFLTVAKPVGAQYGYGQYGAPPPTAPVLVIEKKVNLPSSIKTNVENMQYVDNLSPNDVRFHPGDKVTFRIRVSNASNVAISNITVTDFVSSNITPIEGPGTFDANARTITFNIDNIAPNNEKVFFITMQAQAIPENTVFCPVNKVQVIANNIFQTSTSQFCIEQIAPTGIISTISPTIITPTFIPSAGPEMGLLLTLGELIALGAGLFLKRK